MVAAHAIPTDTTINAAIERIKKKGAGVYYLDSSGKPYTIFPSSIASNKNGDNVGARMAFGFGGKVKQTSAVAGETSNVMIASTRPVFYFYLGERKSEGVNSQQYGALTYPSQFSLIQFKVTKGSREIITGSFGKYSKGSVGLDEKQLVRFVFKELDEPGFYEVSLNEDLKPDQQYAFIPTATATYANTSVYDFGIKKK